MDHAKRVFISGVVVLTFFASLHASAATQDGDRLRTFDMDMIANTLFAMESTLGSIAQMLNELKVSISNSSALAHAAPAAAHSSNTPEALTFKLLTLQKTYAKAIGADRQARQVELLAVARLRKEAMIALVRANPEKALGIALPASLRKTLPPDAQLLTEQDVTLEGDISTLHSDDFINERASYVYDIKTSYGNVSLFPTRDIAIPSGTKVRVHGIRLDDAMALDTSSGTENVIYLSAPGGGGGKVGPQPPTPTITPVLGAQKTLVILVNFSDNPMHYPFTAAQAQTAIFTDINNFFRENSYNQAWLEGDVAGWYTIAMTSMEYWDTSKIQSLGDAAATAAGYNLANYSHILYVTDGVGGYGVSSVGGAPSHSWTKGDITLKIAGHELGHAIGLWHSHSLECGESSTCAPVFGSISEYGDTADIMGSLNDVHLNVYQKERLGWLNYNVSPSLTSVTSSGVYSFAPTEINDLQPKGIKILKGTDPSNGGTQYYYVEYRQLLGFDAKLTQWLTYQDVNNLVHGPLIHMGTEGHGNTSYLLDTTASSTLPWKDNVDAALIVGKTFFDPDSGVSVTTTATSTSAATVSVTFGTSVCVHQNPTVTVSPFSQWGYPGQALLYTVSITNKDNTACASQSFTTLPALPSGWTQTPASFTDTIAPGASVTHTVSVVSSLSAGGGSYSFMEIATNTLSPSHTSSASAGYNVDAALLDATPPTVSITDPIGGTISKRATITLTVATADDKGVARVEYYVNNTLTCTSYYTPYSCPWKVPAKGGVVYQLQAKAYDAAGNVGVSSVVNVVSQ